MSGQDMLLGGYAIDANAGFFRKFWQTFLADENRMGVILNMLREVKWVIMAATMINASFDETDDFNEQSNGQLLWCSVISALEVMAYAAYLFVKQKRSGYTALIAGGQMVDTLVEQKVFPYALATNLAIWPYDWSGYAFANLLISRGWDVNVAQIYMASLATGYFEQAAQYFAVETTQYLMMACRERGDYQSIGAHEQGNLRRLANGLMDIGKILFNSFISVRALCSWYPGAIWNLAFMGLTVELNMTAPDKDNIVYWCKLLGIVTPAVTLGVSIANVCVIMSGEKLAAADSYLVDKLSEVGVSLATLPGRFFRCVTCQDKASASPSTALSFAPAGGMV